MINQVFQTIFGAAPAATARAPGRVNLIGEHTDYNDGFVLPAAIDRTIEFAARPRNDNVVHAYSIDFRDHVEFRLDAIENDEAHPWSNYLRGVLKFLQEEGHRLAGADIAFGGDVPREAGLSSSAAVEVGAVALGMKLFEIELDPLEAVRLARVLTDLLAGDPELAEEPEALGLLALMLLHQARRHARVDAAGDLVLLEDQDRTLWDRDEIAAGTALLDRALALRRPGPYQVQAAIAALHAEAPRAKETDWQQIALLYGRLASMTPSPVVELNHAAAVAMSGGPECGLALLDQLRLAEALDRYHLYHAARADLLRRAGRPGEAAQSYRRALALCQNRIERRFLRKRLAEVESAAPRLQS